MGAIRLTSGEIAQVSAFMREAYGNDFTNKETLINSKMGMLCSQLGYSRFYDFWNEAQGATIAASHLRQKIVDTLTTSYSYFFREDAHFARLAEIVASKAAPMGKGRLRVWSVGCASGEEPYNIAMVLEDACRSGFLPYGYRVVGSDVSSKAISIARNAHYDAADVARLPPRWRSLYCRRSGEGYDVKDILRKRVEFRHENVLAPRFDAPFDIVWCRNMVIYFDKDSVDRLCKLLRGMVKPGGYLFLGHAEILDKVRGFSYVEPSIWQRDGEDLLGLHYSQSAY